MSGGVVWGRFAGMSTMGDEARTRFPNEEDDRRGASLIGEESGSASSSSESNAVVSHMEPSCPCPFFVAQDSAISSSDGPGVGSKSNARTALRGWRCTICFAKGVQATHSPMPSSHLNPPLAVGGASLSGELTMTRRPWLRIVCSMLRAKIMCSTSPVL